MTATYLPTLRGLATGDEKVSLLFLPADESSMQLTRYDYVNQSSGLFRCEHNNCISMFIFYSKLKCFVPKQRIELNVTSRASCTSTKTS